MKPLRKLHPLMKIMSMSITDLPAPMNISLLWNFGSLLGLFLMVQIMTGMMLSIHYLPSTEFAFSSLIHITRNVNWGWMLHNSHMNGASLFMLLMYLHMARGIYYSSFHMKETWNTGVMIFILTMATAFMGYVLPWGQMSFWGATVITNIFSAIPYIGELLVQWIWGGFAVSGSTLNRFFIMHFILPLTIFMLMLLHFMFLHNHGSNNPLGINASSDRTSFHVYFTTKDTMGFTLIIIMFMTTISLFPNMLMDPENFTEANQLLTPLHIQPEWYFLWLYAILRSIPNKLGGVIALLSAILILFLPASFNLDKLSTSFCPPSKFLFFTMINSWFLLSWIGMSPVEKPYMVIGQIFSMMYFLYFIMLYYLLYWWSKYFMN